jgi:hypothetical protein
MTKNEDLKKLVKDMSELQRSLTKVSKTIDFILRKHSEKKIPIKVGQIQPGNLSIRDHIIDILLSSKRALHYRVRMGSNLNI